MLSGKTLSEGSSVGPYQIVRLLGRGGMGVVYEALQPAIARRVALKVLNTEYAGNADAVERLFNEARAVNLIAHPGLVQVSDVGKLPDGAPYLVMELLAGESLAARVRRLRRLPHRTALQLGLQIADALAAAHEKGIIHRDLKPENQTLFPQRRQRHSPTENRRCARTLHTLPLLAPTAQRAIHSEQCAESESLCMCASRRTNKPNWA